MKKILFLSIVLILNSCNKDDADDNISNTSIDLVTGINFRQSVDDTPLVLGNPNIYINNTFVNYPNPSNGTLYLSANATVSKVWIIPANANKIHQQVDFNSLLNSGTYSESQIQAKSQLELNNLNSSTSFIIRPLYNTKRSKVNVF